MDSSAETTRPTAGRGDARRAAILEAAIEEFSANGIRGASMARIAARAGVSRPALYQYFANRDDIFASAFVSLFEGHVERAIEALNRPGPVVDQLDGFLQRYEGDLWHHTAASPHTDEITEAKTGEVATSVMVAVDHLDRELDQWLARVAPGRGRAVRDRRRGWLDLLRLSPRGLRSDGPSVAEYRRRLTTLAHTVAADIER